RRAFDGPRKPSRCAATREVAVRFLGLVLRWFASLLCCAVLRVAAAILVTGIAGPAMSTTVSPPASERIANDTGGRIGSYLTKYEALRKSGQRVMIDGTCPSACTLLLGVIPHNRICVTAAVLAFHAAWDISLTGAQTNTPAAKYLWS